MTLYRCRFDQKAEQNKKEANKRWWGVWGDDGRKWEIEEKSNYEEKLYNNKKNEIVFGS